MKSLCNAPKMISIMPTMACTASCRNCGSFSNPKRKQKLSLNTILNSIHQAKKLGFKSVTFTGGEATIEWDNLLKGIKLARLLNLSPRLVTNAHWANSLKEAKKILDTLIDNGLDNFNISTGDQHSKFIPIENIINVILVALHLKVDFHIMIEYSAKRLITKDYILNHALLKKVAKTELGKIKITESPWMPIDPIKSGCYFPGDVINENNFTMREGCSSILQTYCIEPDGRIAACCGLGIKNIPELYVGNTNEADFLGKAIETAENDFLKLWLRYKGPEKILAWVGNKSEIKWQNMYAHKCQICQRLFNDVEVAKIIRENYEEMISEIIQTIWFDEIFYPQEIKSIHN